MTDIVAAASPRGNVLQPQSDPLGFFSSSHLTPSPVPTQTWPDYRPDRREADMWLSVRPALCSVRAAASVRQQAA